MSEGLQIPEITLTEEQKQQISQIGPALEQQKKRLAVLKRAGIKVDNIEKTLRDAEDLMKGLLEVF